MGAYILRASSSFYQPLPLGSTLLGLSCEPGTQDCQTVLGAREEVRGSYTVASEKAPGEVQITHVCALSTSSVPLAF